MALEYEYEYKNGKLTKNVVRPSNRNVSVETNIKNIPSNRNVSLETNIKIRPAQERMHSKTVFEKASDIMKSLQTTYYRGRGPRYTHNNIFNQTSEQIPKVATQLKSLTISTNEQLEEIARAIVAGLKDRPVWIKPLFEQCTDMKVSTFKEGFEHVKTLKQALNDVMIRDFESLINFRQRVEKLAGKYKGPVEKRNKWVQFQVEKNLHTLKRNLNSELIPILFKEKLLIEDDLFQLLDRLFENLNETSLFCVFQLLVHVGMYMEFGIRFSDWDARSDPRILPYFCQLSTMVDLTEGSNYLSENTVSMVRALLKYRENYWCLTQEISKELSPFK